MLQNFWGLLQMSSYCCKLQFLNVGLSYIQGWSMNTEQVVFFLSKFQKSPLSRFIFSRQESLKKKWQVQKTGILESSMTIETIVIKHPTAKRLLDPFRQLPIGLYLSKHLKGSFKEACPSVNEGRSSPDVGMNFRKYFKRTPCPPFRKLYCAFSKKCQKKFASKNHDQNL